MTDARMRQIYRKLIRSDSRFRPARPETAPGLVNSWVRYLGDGDAWEAIWVFDSADLEAVRSSLATLTDLDGWSPSHSWDCTGESFARPVRLIPQNGRTFATQYQAIDV